MSLTKKEIEEFKKQLLQMRSKLAHTLKETTAEVKSPDQATGYSQHQADQGTDDFDRTISLEVSHCEYNTLRQIERALEKIDENTYGICDITQEEIPIARLKAMPYACTSVKGQQMREKGLL